MTQILHPRAAGESAPIGNEGMPEAAAVPFESEQEYGSGLRRPAHATHALFVICGEARAEQYLARLRAQQAEPDELALTVSMLHGAALRGFCRVIDKAMRGQRHA